MYEYRPDGYSATSFEVWDGEYLLGRVIKHDGRWYAVELRSYYNQTYGSWKQRRSAVQKLQRIADNVI